MNYTWSFKPGNFTQIAQNSQKIQWKLPLVKTNEHANGYCLHYGQEKVIFVCCQPLAPFTLIRIFTLKLIIMNKLTWIILTLLAGALLPVQAGLNAKLGKAAASPLYAALISFLVGTAGLVLYIVLTGQTISWTGLKNAPMHIWLGGLLGAFYIAVMVLAFPELGPGLTFGLIVAGQMVISVVLEHFNILVAKENPVTYLKLLGVALVVVGVIIIRKY